MGWACLWAYIREGLLSEGYLRLRFGELIFGREGLFFYFFFWRRGGGLIIGILLYLVIIYENSSLSSGIVRVSEVLN